MGEAKRRKAKLGDACAEVETQNVRVSDFLFLPAKMVDGYRRGMRILTAEAVKIEPSHQGAFTRRAAAVHEASHCVVAKREGREPLRASIWEASGAWLAAFWTEGSMEEVNMTDPSSVAPRIRITLAGRRGELLFAPQFSVYAGLDELVLCQMAVTP